MLDQQGEDEVLDDGMADFLSLGFQICDEVGLEALFFLEVRT